MIEVGDKVVRSPEYNDISWRQLCINYKVDPDLVFTTCFVSKDDNSIMFWEFKNKGEKAPFYLSRFTLVGKKSFSLEDYL